jgi:AcrR family transcriptional regulator
MSTKSAKQKILDAASILFYNDGITNTGINSITDKAQVAKMSLYNNFPTKSDLISCYIEARHQEWLELFEKGKLKFTHLLMAFSLFLMLTMIMQSLPMKKVLGAAAC